MMSHKMIITRDHTGKDKIIRYWDIGQIQNNRDAMVIDIGDVIEHGEMYFKVTYKGNSKRDGHRAWCGRIFNSPAHWGLKDDEVIAWGPRGVASNFSYYDDGNFYDFCLGTDGYLWVGDKK